MNAAADYGDEHIRTLDWKEHIRRRPGMYIGKLGDGTSADDGIYILIKEVLDNSIDEYMMGFGKTIDVTVGDDGRVSVRDYGRGIPLGKLVDVGLEDEHRSQVRFEGFQEIRRPERRRHQGRQRAVERVHDPQRPRRRGAAPCVSRQARRYRTRPRAASATATARACAFVADRSVFGEYAYHMEYVETMIRNYTYLNAGLTIRVNGQGFRVAQRPAGPAQREFRRGAALSADSPDGDRYRGGDHARARLRRDVLFVRQRTAHDAGRDASGRVPGSDCQDRSRSSTSKDFDAADIRTSVIAAISVKVEESHVREPAQDEASDSKDMGPDGGPSVRNFVVDFRQGPSSTTTCTSTPRRPTCCCGRWSAESEKERKAISGVQKKAREMAKKVSLNNKKLRDCQYPPQRRQERPPGRAADDFHHRRQLRERVHHQASRDVTHAGRLQRSAASPSTAYGLTKRVVYENEEFNLLQAALNIEEDIGQPALQQGHRRRRDADVDGMHIRLLVA